MVCSICACFGWKLQWLMTTISESCVIGFFFFVCNPRCVLLWRVCGVNFFVVHFLLSASCCVLVASFLGKCWLFIIFLLNILYLSCLELFYWQAFGFDGVGADVFLSCWYSIFHSISALVCRLLDWCWRHVVICADWLGTSLHGSCCCWCLGMDKFLFCFSLTYTC